MAGVGRGSRARPAALGRGVAWRAVEDRFLAGEIVVVDDALSPWALAAARAAKAAGEGDAKMRGLLEQRRAAAVAELAAMG